MPKSKGLPFAIQIDEPEPRQYSDARAEKSPDNHASGKLRKACDEPEGEGYFDAYETARRTRALVEGKGGTGCDDVPQPGVLLSDIATSWSRPFSGNWPEQYLAEEAGSREMLETHVQNRDAERAYAEADKNTPGDRRYDLGADSDSDD